MATGIIASNLKMINKSTLIAAVDLEIVRWKLLIRECTWHRKDNREWVSFCAREWKDAQGNRRFANFIEFTDDLVKQRFQKAALDAVHAIAGGP